MLTQMSQRIEGRSRRSEASAAAEGAPRPPRWSAARWRAALRRDARRDGTFVFAVRSTGIYCRPSCPARRPNRQQVTFFRTAEEAGRAGFRPCRRCAPERAREVPADSAPRAAGSGPMEAAASAGAAGAGAAAGAPGPAGWIADICRAIDSDPEYSARLADLAARAGLAPHRLLRAFRRATGVTPRQYADAVRMRRVRDGLQRGEDVTAALYDAGFGSASRLYERSAAHLGMTPARYRRGGSGERIDFTTLASPLGRLLVAATGRGVCAVRLGDSDAALAAGLRREYPRAEVRRSPALLRAWGRAVLEQVLGRPPLRELPLDVRATAFQRRVWEALRAIPPGQTRTYAQIARALGRPRAARAVGGACARNPVAILVPCHRAVRGDGGLGGYAWGLARKRELLRRESAGPQGTGAPLPTIDEAGIHPREEPS